LTAHIFERNFFKGGFGEVSHFLFLTGALSY
jgi:hypothetical protein